MILTIGATVVLTGFWGIAAVAPQHPPASTVHQAVHPSPGEASCKPFFCCSPQYLNFCTSPGTCKGAGGIWNPSTKTCS